MRLNLPILDHLQNSQRILIAGAGGGFDIFAGLPLYFTLREQGKTVFLANLSFTERLMAELVSETVKLDDSWLFGARGGVKRNLPYLPEPYLADWFQKTLNEAMTVWLLPNEGSEPLRLAYTTLVDHLKPDALILVDGGVDSIMRGDEMGAGTLLEDTLSLVAVENLPIPVKILACLGFGTEVEEQVCHYNALENMAALVKAGAFYGSCALTPQMQAFQLYEAACRYVFEQPGHHQSHISTRVIPAVHGEFGNHHMTDYHRKSGVEILVSPLMSLYWFFDAETVTRHNTLVPLLRGTNTKRQAFLLATEYLSTQRGVRPRRFLPY
jgi:hypothetical protein